MRKWIRRFFFAWAAFVTLYLANSVRTQRVEPRTLVDSANSEVSDAGVALVFEPKKAPDDSALAFVCGSGIAAQAYAPLLRPIADAGYPVFIVRLPYRFAPLDSHKDEALARIGGIIQSRAGTRWVLSGHSLGAALAARFATENRDRIASLVLIGT
ncbi:MAG TPA: alpha/beta hydrolase, partial [Thermoanaerobaculia bacterium]